MIIDIGNILIGKIDTLPFVDKIIGVVKTVSFTDTISYIEFVIHKNFIQFFY